MRRAIGASVLATLALTACASSTSSPSTTSRAGSRTSAKPSSAPVPVNQSAVQTAPGGSPVKVTLVSYRPEVPEPTGDALTPKVFAVTLRLENLGARAVNAQAPSYYSILRLEDTAGASTVPHASGPCSGSFYSSPIHLTPHGSEQGCIPYAYGDSRPVTFGFGFGLRATQWKVGSG